MLAHALVAVLAVAPKLATTTFTVIGLSADRGDFYTEHLSVQLASLGAEVRTPRDISSVLGLERQKQLLGCDQGSSCLSELAGALGVDELITGQVALVDGAFQVVLKVLRTKDGSTRLARSARAASESALLSQLGAWAGEIVGVASASKSLVPLIPAGLGLVALGVGAGFLVDAGNALAALKQRVDPLTYDGALAAKSRGESSQTLGLIIGGVGVAAMLSGSLWFLLAPSKPASVSFVPTPSGFAFVGVWP